MTKEDAFDWVEGRIEHYELDEDGQELAKALKKVLKLAKNSIPKTQINTMKKEIKALNLSEKYGKSCEKEVLSIIRKYTK